MVASVQCSLVGNMSKSWRKTGAAMAKPSSRMQPSIPNKPAFIVKPFAGSSQPSGWSSSSGLANMRHPSGMTSEELGQACVSAAREQVDSPKLWMLLSQRASAIADNMEPRDISLLLNGMSRTRTLAEFGPSLLPALLPTIEKKLPYFSSIQIAMLISAISKLPPQSQLLPPSMIKEIKSRVHEFLTPVEFSMLMTALTKLGISDASLYTRLSSFIQSRMNSSPYHVRDLSVIAHAFAAANFRDLTLFERIYEKSVPTLPEATPVEFARLISAFLKVQSSPEIVSSLISQTTEIVAQRFKYMNPTELVSTVYAFASICEHHHEANELAGIFSALKQSFFANFPLLQVKDIASVLTSLSRWKITLTDDEEQVLVDKLSALRLDRIDPAYSVAIAASLAGIFSDSSISTPILFHLYPSLLAGIEASHTDWSLVARALKLAIETLPDSDQLIAKFSARVVKDIKGFRSVDRSTRIALTDTLSRKLGAEHDLVITISD